MQQSTEDSSELLFGLETITDWLNKAIREKDRFLATEDMLQKTDHALNFSITISHLEDWAYHLLVKENAEWPSIKKDTDFDIWVREQCPAMQIIADICNAGKHRVLRTRRSEAKNAEIGGFVYNLMDFPGVEDFIERISKYSEIVDIQKDIIEEEQQYFIRTNVHMISTNNGFKLFIDVMNEAIRFWEGFISERNI